jgi:hypothetical protein
MLSRASVREARQGARITLERRAANGVRRGDSTVYNLNLWQTQSRNMQVAKKYVRECYVII